MVLPQGSVESGKSGLKLDFASFTDARNERVRYTTYGHQERLVNTLDILFSSEMRTKG